MNPTDEFTKAVESALPRLPDYNIGLLPDEEGYNPEMERAYYDRSEALASIQAATANLLKEVRFNSYWGDGSPAELDDLIKQFDATYDPMQEIDCRDDQLIKDLSNE